MSCAFKAAFVCISFSILAASADTNGVRAGALSLGGPSGESHPFDTFAEQAGTIVIVAVFGDEY